MQNFNSQINMGGEKAVWPFGQLETWSCLTGLMAGNKWREK